MSTKIAERKTDMKVYSGCKTFYYKKTASDEKYSIWICGCGETACTVYQGIGFIIVCDSCEADFYLF